MKKILALAGIILILPSLTFAQKKKPAVKPNPFFSFDAGVMKFKDAEVQPAGSIAFGMKFNAKKTIVSVGLGILFSPFNGGGLYTPFFLQLMAYQQTKKISPVLQARIGYGSYNNHVRVFNQDYKVSLGGAFIEPGIGIHIPAKRSGVNFIISYINSTFAPSDSRYNSASYTTDGFAASIGVSF